MRNRDEMYYDGTITYKEWMSMPTPTNVHNVYTRPDEKAPVVDFKQEFEYRWYHTSTGTWGTRKVRMDTRLDFLEQLNKWNTIGDGHWVYTERA